MQLLVFLSMSNRVVAETDKDVAKNVQNVDDDVDVEIFASCIFDKFV